ncbi:MAG: methyl-accepting chemotaxis protein [Ruminiclostridium sp.]|nr:methyl-accepting chemotaxis protein [Ruminiclostridium sp.]
MKLFKKLGFQIILLSVASLAITVAIVLTTSMLMFVSYNDTILVERSRVGMQVLENTVKEKTGSLKSTFTTWSEQSSFVSAMTFNDISYFEKTWKELSSSDADFCAIANPRGGMMYKSENYPFTSFDLAGVAKGNVSINGLIVQDDVLAAVYCGQVSANGVSSGLVVGFRLDSAEWMDQLKKMIDCDTTIFKGNTRYSTTIVDPSTNQRVIGTTMASNMENTVLNSKSNYEGKATIVGKPYYVSYSPMYDYQNKVIGAYFAGNNASAANDQFSTVIIISIIIALVALAATAVIVLVFTRKKVITPVNMVTILADEMQNGKLSTTEVDYNFSDNEIGVFAEKLRYAKSELSNCIADISSIMQRMSQGDFTAEPNVTYPGDFEEIKRSILQIEEDLGATLSKMNMSSDEVLSGSNQMAEGSQSLADGTTKQAAAIQQISATIADVSSKVADTAKNAARAGDISKQTAEEVNLQDASISNMVLAMNEISDTSKEIEKIIKAIEDISFQTNILALNAAVEAARAGDAGKGFAVVADEVRNLANKSAEAAQSTTALITASIDAVNKGSRIAKETAESMKKVKEKTAETGELILMIADASAEQTEAISEITSGIEQISQVVQMNSATAEETAASCEELNGQSRLLKDQVSRFRINE